MRQSTRTSNRIRATSRRTKYCKSGQAKMGRQGLHVVGPVCDTSTGLEIGETEPGAIRRDHTQSVAMRDITQAPYFETRGRKAVEEE